MAGLNWRWLRGRGKLPVSFFVCAVLSFIIALVGKTQSSIVDSARADLSDMTAPMLTAVRAPLVAFERWTSELPTLFNTYNENIQLKQENAELKKWQNVALSLEERVHQYEVLLNAVPDRDMKSVTARVIGESNRPFVSTMILNAGAKEGVRKGQAVLDDRGLIGRIYLTGAHTSWVILLTDLNSRVPVVIEPSHRRAILAGNNTATPQLELDVGDGKIAAGDRVLTTGDGGVLPPDLPIGTVMSENGTMQVVLFAGTAASDFVQVLDYGDPAGPPVATAADIPPPPAPLASVVEPPPPPLPVKKRPAAPAPERASLAQPVPEVSEDEDR